jgi:serine/threonine protein kinase
MGVFDSLKKVFGGGPARVNIQQRFELFGKSGQGSMSRVWRARDRQTGKIVCLKVLDKEKTAQFQARFGGARPPEGEIATQLHHRNLVETFEHGLTTDGEQYLVMEWLDGKGLNFLLDAGGSELAGQRMKIVTHLADAIDYMHQQKFLHRDLCPRNVLIAGNGEPKLIDFGLTVPYTPEFCKPGNRTGTANYLAPEIIRRLPTDHRVDVFSLGVLAYEVFTNHLPWQKTESMENLLRVMNTPGQDPREFNPDLDEGLARVLLKAIEREPARRFASAADFKAALVALKRKDY